MTGVCDEHDWIQYMKACTLILERPSIKRYVRSVPGSKGELDLISQKSILASLKFFDVLYFIL